MRERLARLLGGLRPDGAALLAILGLALALRIWGVGWGLPYSFVNADESTVVPIAFRVATGRLDPQFFLYPSLFFYLLGGAYVLAAPVLWLALHTDPLSAGAYVLHRGEYFLLGRLLSVAFGVISVYLLYRLGRVAFGRAAGLVAALALAVAPLHVAYSHMAVTDVTATALSLLALLLLLEAAGGRGQGWLIAGAAAAGLATSTKYNLGLLVLPATVAGAYACRDEARRRVAEGARAAGAWARPLLRRVWLPMLAGFVGGSPFVVLDAPHFVSDFVRQSRIMSRGWLGFEEVGNGWWYNLHVNLSAGIGVALTVLAVAGLAWALWRRTPLDLMAAPYVLVYFVYIGTWKELADRYLLPILPLLALLAVRACLEIAGQRPGWRRATLPAVGVLLAAALVQPMAASLAFDRALSGTDTRERAKSWMERNVPSGSVVASENHGPQLVPLADQGFYRAAGIGQAAYRLRRLALPLPGVPNPEHSLGWLRRNHVDYVVVSSRVYDRVRAAAGRYPGIVAFYRDLEERGELIAEFRPRTGERGPTLKVYRLPAEGTSE